MCDNYKLQVFKANTYFNDLFDDKTYGYELYKVETNYIIDKNTLASLISSGEKFNKKIVEKYFRFNSSTTILHTGIFDKQSKQYLEKNFNFQLNFSPLND